jgi:hypothetical protein
MEGAESPERPVLRGTLLLPQAELIDDLGEALLLGSQERAEVGRPEEPAWANKMVWPSAGRPAAWAAAVPPAPGRFSTAKGCGSTDFAASARARAKTSAPPPGAKPTTNVMGRVGKSGRPCAREADGSPPARSRASVAKARTPTGTERVRISGLLVWMVSADWGRRGRTCRDAAAAPASHGAQHERIER